MVGSRVSLVKAESKSHAVKASATRSRSTTSLLSSNPTTLLSGSKSSLNTNRSVIQSRPKLNLLNDQYEQEADRVADQVMSMPDTGAVQNQSLPLQNAAGLPHQSQPVPLRPQALAKAPAETAQRQEQADEEEDIELPVQAKASGHTSTVTTHFTNGLQSLRGGGHSLPLSARHFFEPRIGYDFSTVRIHSDTRASSLAAEINARAFTQGADIVFGAGQYQPDSDEGRRLIAHELTHVMQQSGASVDRSLVQRKVPPTTAPADGGLNQDMLRQIARRLREAMAGWGTDEEAIYSSFSGRTQEQVDAIARVYQEMFQRSLIDDLRDELTDSEMQHLAIFSPTVSIREGVEPSRSLADMIAYQLNQAMDRIGTDEESVYAALTGRTVAERLAIKTAYQRLTGRDLEADIRSEFSGSELTEALRLLNQGMLAPEDELYLAMTGIGTDEATVFRVLEGLGSDINAIRALEAAYRRKYGDLMADLQSDLTAAEYARALRSLRLLSRYLPDVRYSSRLLYGYSQRDASKLYGMQSAPGLVPASAFNQQSTTYTGYPQKWQNSLDLNQILGNLANDCGQYARHLIGLAGRTPNMRSISQPGIALRPAAGLQPGEAYFIRPVASGGEAVAEDVLAPWNHTDRVRKSLTNFHVATVVARDNTTVVTSEVNAAFQHFEPWFTMYQGNRGFYRTYRREYRADGRDPELMRM